MAKFPEAEARLFHNKFVCKKCKSVVRASNMLVTQGKVSCKKCGSPALRVKRRK